MDTLEHDAALDQVLVAVPEAKDVFIGRRVLNMTDERTYYWAVEVTMPRRDKRFRVIHGVETLRASGDTVQGAIAEVLRFVHFHKTGALPETA